MKSEQARNSQEMKAPGRYYVLISSKLQPYKCQMLKQKQLLRVTSAAEQSAPCVNTMRISSMRQTGNWFISIASKCVLIY